MFGWKLKLAMFCVLSVLAGITDGLTISVLIMFYIAAIARGLINPRAGLTPHNPGLGKVTKYQIIFFKGLRLLRK